MKSTEVYRIIHGVLGVSCKQNGFTEVKTGMLAYYRPWEDRYLSFWFQCDQRGWDQYAGSSFTMEFQLCTSPEPGGSGLRKRFPEFLTSDQLEWVRARQNQVIRGIPAPARKWVSQYDVPYPSGETQMMIKAWRAQWTPVKEPCPLGHDIWLRYWQEDDVRQWAVFLLGLLPEIVVQMAPG